jgi:autotransporter-associated beta strand protein
MKPTNLLRSFLLAASSSLLAISQLQAADGTWVGNANWWSDPASWVSGITPTGTDGTANFTGVDITGNINKPLGGAGQNRTIGNIIFTDATTSSHDLTLSANTLTLDVTSGQPNIDVTQSGRTLTISSTVAGNDGLQKSGLGTLTLNSANTFTGNIAVSAGTLSANFNGGGAANPTATALGNTQTVGRTATISSGATLRFNIADVMGNGGGTPLLTIIANGGTILNGGNFINSLGPVELNGGTLNSSGTGDGFKLTGTVTVGGSAVSTIQANASGFVGSGGVTTYNVADAVAGSGSDLNVTARLSGIFGSGGVTKTGAGTMTLSNQNTYTGLTRIDAGTLALAHATNTLADTGTVNVNGGTLALGSNSDTVGAVTLTSGSITSSTGTLTGTGSAYDVRSGSVSTKLAGTVGLNKSTSGTVTLTGDNSYTGATSITGGTLHIDGTGDINSSSGITVSTGGHFKYNSSTDLTAGLTFTGGTISGTNLNGVSFTVGTGQTISPGNSPGTMLVENQTWASGGTYDFEILNATGTAGTDWDLLSGDSTLTITASPGNTFLIDLTSLSSIGPDVAGDVNGFDLDSDYAWKIADFFNTVSGFDADAFAINASGFSNTLNGAFGIALGDTVSGGDNSQIYLTYTAIPEPSAALLGGLGLLALLRRRRA